jgi:hypothetical protein
MTGVDELAARTEELVAEGVKVAAEADRQADRLERNLWLITRELRGGRDD